MSRKNLIRPAAFLALVWLCLAWPGPAWSSQAAGSEANSNFNRAADRVAKELARAKAEQAELKTRQAAELAKLQNRVEQLRADIAAQEAARQKAAQELEKAHQRRAELEQSLSTAADDLDILIGHVRVGARDLLALAQSSPLTTEHPDRLAFLKGLLSKTRYPGLADIQKLIDQFFLQIEQDGRINSRTGPLVDDQGLEQTARLVRLGGLTTIYSQDDKVGYAVVSPASGRLVASAGDPGWLVRRNLRAYIRGEADQVYLDVSSGTALELLSQNTGWWDYLLSGGPLIWPILAVGLLALIFILERLIFLGRVRSNTDKVMDRVNALVAQGDFKGAAQAAQSQPGRPTSNVILAGLALQGGSPETIESGLSEAMLKELPRLERFLTVLKVLAAVAPLLGLLGTVTGMINTFHVITAFGAGEPRLMAGGISEALVTTQLGLAVAIPIMVAAALLSRQAQRITGDMEEKAVALSAALIDRAPADRPGEAGA